VSARRVALQVRAIGSYTPRGRLSFAVFSTPQGRAEYGKRKSVVEPVFGIIKEVLKFRQFLLRGMKKAKGEWTLAYMAYNLKRMHIMQTS